MKNNLLQAVFIISSSLFSHSLFAQDDEFKLDEVYRIDAKGTIELYTDDADVRITGTNRNDVHVYIYRKVITRGIQVGHRNFDVEVDERGGDLIIRERESNGYSVMSIGYQSEEYEVTIEAPEGVGLVIKGDDDDYDIKNINGSIDMDIDDGDVKLTECNGNHFEFKVDDGDIDLRGGTGFLYIRSDDGDVVVTNGSFSEITADLDDGDLFIETSLSDRGDYTFDIDDGTIDLKILDGGGEFKIFHDDSRISSSEAFRLLEEDENETHLRLSNGNARIRIHADDARVRLSSL